MYSMKNGILYQDGKAVFCVGLSYYPSYHEKKVPVPETCDRVAIMYAGEIVECGSIEDIFENARHPYTVGLFNSIPSLHKEMDRLQPIPGLMPDPANLPVGCAFADRGGRRIGPWTARSWQRSVRAG